MSELIVPDHVARQLQHVFYPTICVGRDENGKLIEPPRPATPGSAGYDLAASTSVTIMPRTTEMVPTGIKIALPPGIYGQICSRSSLGAKKGISVAQGVGIIDSDYRGEIYVPLYNRGGREYQITCGDKIAQMILLPYALIQFQITTDPNQLPETLRGAGGFGSTGT